MQDPRKIVQPEPGDEESPKICFCMNVHRDTLVRSWRAGTRELHDLIQTTRAGSGCGTCRMDLIRLLESLERTPDAQ